MRKGMQTAFVVLVGLVLIFPVIGFDRKSEVSVLENRTLAGKPRFNWKDFREYDMYFQDRFGGRDCLVRLGNWFDYKILHRSLHTEKALGGRGGWLFYINPRDGNNLADFNKKNLLDSGEMEQLKSKIQSLVEWCEANNLKYLFVLAPSKHSVYPEYYPFKRPDGITRLQQIDSLFRDLGVVCVNPLDTLLSLKKQEGVPLYFETDSHWNYLGAYHAARMIKTEIEKQFPEIAFPEWTPRIEVGYSDTKGDILPLLGLDHARSTQPMVWNGTTSFTNYFTADGFAYTRHFHAWTTNSELPSAIVFRDSFCTHLVLYLSTLFSRTEYIRKSFQEEDKEYVLQNKPDMVIFEAAERYAVSIAGK